MFIKQTNGLKKQKQLQSLQIYSRQGMSSRTSPLILMVTACNIIDMLKNATAEVSAIGLENLSESTKLSKPPQIKRKKSLHLPKYLPCGSPRRRNTPLCPVHRRICSSQYTSALLMQRRFRCC
ncbi:hypothetical protein ACFX2C_020774 [Malus domestica]